MLRRVPETRAQDRPRRGNGFDQPARQFLQKADIIQASVWIVARLAEGLDHAHARGLLHRDLKPSNILIAGDGTPMLLDFNLSTLAKPDHEDEGEKAMLGGTLPYMSPEHLAAFDPRESTQQDAVDERSDLYSLGLILHEMVVGAHPFPEPSLGTPLSQTLSLMKAQRMKVPSPRTTNPAIPWSLQAIIQKCLDPDPGRRHASAREFSEDLQRFLDDMPLKHTAEPSLRERAAKWIRRNPRICNGSSIAAFASVLIIGLGGLMGLLSNNMQTLSARLKLRVARAEMDECRFLLNHVSGPVEHLDRGLARAAATRRLLELTPTGTIPTNAWIHRLDRLETEEMRAMASEVILLESRARVDLARTRGNEDDRREAVEWAARWLGAAERLDPAPPAALYEDRARYHAALGMATEAARDREMLARHAPTSARDHLLLGMARLSRGETGPSEAELNLAVRLAPQSFWAWFTLGLCHLESNRFADAAGDFAASIAIAPKFAWPRLNRGVALSRSGRLEDARLAYKDALELNPRFAEAWLNLALVSLELNDLSAADQALRQAVALGRNEPAILAAQAEVKSRLGNRPAARALFDGLLSRHPDDPDWLAARGIASIQDDPNAAQADLGKAIEIDPHHARAHYGLALLLRRSSPRDALLEAEAALHSDPQLLDALQLRALLRARLGDLRAIDDADRLCLVPTPHRLYNAACVFALLAATAENQRLAGRALGTLERALDAGFPAGHAASDPDLRTLHPMIEFQRLLRKTMRRGHASTGSRSFSVTSS